MVKNLSASTGDEEAQVQSLGREDPLEEGMATHSSTLAWRIPWTEKPGGLQSMGSQRVGHDRTHQAAITVKRALGEVRYPLYFPEFSQHCEITSQPQFPHQQNDSAYLKDSWKADKIV